MRGKQKRAHVRRGLIDERPETRSTRVAHQRTRMRTARRGSHGAANVLLRRASSPHKIPECAHARVRTAVTAVRCMLDIERHESAICGRRTRTRACEVAVRICCITREGRAGATGRGIRPVNGRALLPCARENVDRGARTWWTAVLGTTHSPRGRHGGTLTPCTRSHAAQLQAL